MEQLPAQPEGGVAERGKGGVTVKASAVSIYSELLLFWLYVFWCFEAQASSRISRSGLLTLKANTTRN